MRMQVARLAGCVLASGMMIGCQSNHLPVQLPIYELPVGAQKDYFMSLTAEEQVDVLLASFKRRQAWDMRLLDWLAASGDPNVGKAIRSKIASESDDWHVESLALAVERMSTHHACRIGDDEAQALLESMLEKTRSPPARNTIEQILSRHANDPCESPQDSMPDEK